MYLKHFYKEESYGPWTFCFLWCHCMRFMTSQKINIHVVEVLRIYVWFVPLVLPYWYFLIILSFECDRLCCKSLFLNYILEIYSFIPRLNLDRIKWYWVHQSCDNGIPVLAFPGTFSYMVQLVFTYTSRHLDITE